MNRISRLVAFAAVLVLACGPHSPSASPINEELVYIGRRSGETGSGQQPQVVPTAEVDEFKLWTKFANAAYCNVTDWACGKACEGDTAGTRLIKYFHTEAPFSNNGYVAVHDERKTIISSFRGTADVDSLITDIRFNLVPYDNHPGARVHDGFYSTYQETSKELVPLVISLSEEFPDYRVVNVGHSMGGNLAVFHALDLIGSGKIPKERMSTYTFGEPRCGNKEFAEFVESAEASGYEFNRLVNRNDIVPHLPPLSFNVKHYGPEYWISQNNTDTVVKCLTAEDPACSNSQVPNITLLPPHAKYFDTAFLLTCLVK